MRISEILKDITYRANDTALLSMEVDDIAADDRRVKDGVKTLFFAYSGTDFDSHAVAAELYRSGRVAAVVSERAIAGVPAIVAAEGRKNFALACKNLFLNPASELTMVGVTGTNGKTTITWILESICKAAGMGVVRIGTTGASVMGEVVETDNTTPSPYDFYKLLRMGVDKGARVALAEVSSHALAQDRLHGVFFDVATFTNLTGDHMDYHKDIETYYQAKRLLFNEEHSRKQVINVTHDQGARLYSEADGERFSYSIDKECDFSAYEYYSGASGIDAELMIHDKRFKYNSKLVGDFNLENIIAAVGTAVAMGIPISATQDGVAALENVPGRLEKYTHNGVAAFVDYAHTDDALKNVLIALKKICGGKLITLFGAGGDRDKTKRPRMGAIAQKYSDEVVVTSDNPRTEDLMDIIADILEGMTPSKSVHIKPDRAEAIKYAIEIAQSGDIVLIAGKGHEDYQIVGKTKHHFSDSEHVKLAFEGRS
ncbi:MAG: UDP-N-acetylmuramoyl-L-alanyl-D-glutamate--2,6-diaminopimelate ligase [Deferribacteraceae bacterium]|jgi:UDP-N-acetylmuramoyl-L-alanyl-D-glutamate--2,6-diaminopimelate ligase|nr:UDP-N-acetylmuramoyl-L-alanyl-D-glutamate--2,6-diaminopimelate ligase [Deferribacteraceae bacterium]